MKSALYFSILFISFSLPGCSSVRTGRSDLSAKDLHVYGRTIIDEKGELELVTSAAHFGFSFEGQQAEVYVSVPNRSGHNYIQYELDGVYQKKLRIDGNLTQPIIINAGKSGKHQVWIYKATEAHTGPVLIRQVAANEVKAIRKPELPVIEFIGNSITCGAAADPSEFPCGTGEYHDQHNAYYAYGPRVARILNTEFVLSSISGYGIYRTWNRERPSLPLVYEKVDFQESNPQLWDFKTFTPKIVTIALGTNDISEGDHQVKRDPFDTSRFINAYVSFVQTVKSKYPNAQLVLLNSPMVSGSRGQVLENSLRSIKQKVDLLYPASSPVELFYWKPMQARGCGGHPSVEDHAIMADQLALFLKRFL
ncbi:MAG: GDSL-type esterase/lipase family protein [Candidatus Dadabacteria bacterium]